MVMVLESYNRDQIRWNSKVRAVWGTSGHGQQVKVKEVVKVRQVNGLRQFHIKHYLFTTYRQNNLNKLSIWYTDTKLV